MEEGTHIPPLPNTTIVSSIAIDRGGQELILLLCRRYFWNQINLNLLNSSTRFIWRKFDGWSPANDFWPRRWWVHQLSWVPWSASALQLHRQSYVSRFKIIYYIYYLSIPIYLLPWEPPIWWRALTNLRWRSDDQQRLAFLLACRCCWLLSERTESAFFAGEKNLNPPGVNRERSEVAIVFNFFFFFFFFFLLVSSSWKAVAVKTLPNPLLVSSWLLLLMASSL